MWDVVGVVLSPLTSVGRWTAGHIGRWLDLTDEPVLKIHVLQNVLAPHELDVASVVIENVGRRRAGATRPARGVRVRCSVDEHGPFDLYWAEPEPVLALDLLEDEDKSVDLAVRWPGPGLYGLEGAQLAPGVTYLHDPALLRHGFAGQALDPGSREIEVICHYGETGRARAHFVLHVPEPEDDAPLELEEKKA